MGKLADMVAEQSSLRHRIKYNVRRFRLAGIGLFSKVDAERTRLYKQLLEASDQRAADAGLLRRVNALSLGAISLAWEEGQRVFDGLVAAGEQATTRPRRASSLRGLDADAAPVSVPAPEATAGQPATAAPARTGKSSKTSSVDKQSAAAVSAVLATPANVKHLDSARKRTAALPPAADSSGDVAAFERAVQRLAARSERPDQATQLALYALFKQATEGDVKGRRPAVAKVVERAKFDARRDRKGMAPEAARQAYCQMVDGLMDNDTQ